MSPDTIVAIAVPTASLLLGAAYWAGIMTARKNGNGKPPVVGKDYVTKEFCQLQHKNEDEWRSELRAAIGQLRLDVQSLLKRFQE